MYPILKSNNASLILNFSSFFVFSNVQIDCQIYTSKGAGIHPIKAAKNTKPTWFFGII